MNKNINWDIVKFENKNKGEIIKYVEKIENNKFYNKAPKTNCINIIEIDNLSGITTEIYISSLKKCIKETETSNIFYKRSFKPVFSMMDFEKRYEYLLKNDYRRIVKIINKDDLYILSNILIILMLNENLTFSTISELYFIFKNEDDIKKLEKDILINNFYVVAIFIKIMIVNKIIMEKTMYSIDLEEIDNSNKKIYTSYIIYVEDENFKEFLFKLNLSRNFLTVIRDNEINLSSKTIFNQKDFYYLEKYFNESKIKINNEYYLFVKNFVLKDFETYISIVHPDRKYSMKDKKVIKSTEYDKIIEYFNMVGKNEQLFLSCAIKHKQDFRGRVYTITNPFRFIGSKYLRPIFDLKDFDMEKDFEMQKKYSIEIMINIFKEKYRDYDDCVNKVKIKRFDEILLLDNDLKYYAIYFKINGYLNNFQIDCKCSGYQHFFGLFKHELISKVGLISNIEGDADFYLYIANKVIRIIEKNFANKTEFISKADKKKIKDSKNYPNFVPTEYHISCKRILEKIEKYNVNKRTIFKKIVITYLYGAQTETLIKYLKEGLGENAKYFTSNELFIILKCFKESYNDINLDLKILNRRLFFLYLNVREFPKLYNTKIKFIYYQQMEINKKYIFLGKICSYKIIVPTPILNLTKIEKTMNVNIIHTQDWVFLRKLVRIDYKVKCVTIHDCVVCLPSEISYFQIISKYAFLDIYSGNYLETFLNNIKFKENANIEIINICKKYLLSRVGKNDINPNDICFRVVLK